MWRISKLEEDLQNFDEIIEDSQFDVNYFRPRDENDLEKEFMATAELRKKQDEGQATYRLESVKHAREDHLHPDGIAAGLEAAAKGGLHSFDEEDEDDVDYDDESYGSKGTPVDSKATDEEGRTRLYDEFQMQEVEDENGIKRNVRLLDTATMKELTNMLS